VFPRKMGKKLRIINNFKKINEKLAGGGNKRLGVK
jgi:hypothetical protein